MTEQDNQKNLMNFNSVFFSCYTTKFFFNVEIKRYRKYCNCGRFFKDAGPPWNNSPKTLSEGIYLESQKKEPCVAKTKTLTYSWRDRLLAHQMYMPTNYSCFYSGYLIPLTYH